MHNYRYIFLIFKIIHTVSLARLNDKNCRVRKWEWNEMKCETYITAPKAPCPISTGSRYRMGTVNSCPPQVKVCHSIGFVVLVAMFIFAKSKAEICEWIFMLSNKDGRNTNYISLSLECVRKRIFLHRDNVPGWQNEKKVTICNWCDSRISSIHTIYGRNSLK